MDCFFLSFHKVLCEMWNGDAENKGGFLHRNFPTLFSTGMQIPPGGNRHVLYKWRIEIRVSAHFSFLVLVCLQETNCYGFAGWKEVQPSIYLIHTW